MLYIVCKDENGIRHDYTWHVGQAHPAKTKDGLAFAPNEVHEVQADGDELEHILSGSFPFRIGRVVRFFGDDARFIVANSL